MGEYEFQDDLETKLRSREIGKKPNKTTMSNLLNSWYNSSINPEINRDSTNLTTQFDSDLINSSDLNTFFRMCKSDIEMNTEFLFETAEELLKEYSIDINKTKDTYGKKSIVYTLPVTGQIDMNLDPRTALKKDESLFLFKGKYYDSSIIYRINLAHSDKLNPVCPSKLEEPECIPPSIQLIQTSASDGNRYFNLIHSSNLSFTYGWRGRGTIEFEHEDEIKNSSCSNSSYTLVKEKCNPIYVKINQKGQTKITHLGFLGCPVPVLIYTRKRPSTKYGKMQRKTYNKMMKSFHILDTDTPISYVKKLEIWFRGSKTKKWNFLKVVNLSLNGLTACYQEEVIPIFSNFNDLEGLETTELKIVPLEYVNSPSIRIACYGTVQSQFKHKTKTGDECETVNYTVTKPDYSNLMIKHGSHWHDSYNRGLGSYSKNARAAKRAEFGKEINRQLDFMNEL
jgi:hypothetical protein